MKKIIKFDDIEIQKQKFQHNGPISIKNVDIDKIVVSNKVSFSKKGFLYFIGYKDAKQRCYLWTDLSLGQNSKNKIQIFLNFTFLIFCPR